LRQKRLDYLTRSPYGIMNFFPMGWSFDGDKIFFWYSDFNHPEGMFLIWDFEKKIVDTLCLGRGWAVGFDRNLVFGFNTKNEFFVYENRKMRKFKGVMSPGHGEQIIASKDKRNIYIINNRAEIWEYLIENKEVKKICDAPLKCSKFSMSPDGKKCAYISGGVVLVRDLEDKKSTADTLKYSVKELKWNKSGDILVFLKEGVYDSFFLYQQHDVVAFPLEKFYGKDLDIQFADDSVSYIGNKRQLIIKQYCRKATELTLPAFIGFSKAVSPDGKWYYEYASLGFKVREIKNPLNSFRFTPLYDMIVKEYEEIINIDNNYGKNFIDYAFSQRLSKEDLEDMLNRYGNVENIYKIEALQAKDIMDPVERIEDIERLKQKYHHDETALRVLDNLTSATINHWLITDYAELDFYLSRKEFDKVLDKIDFLKKYVKSEESQMLLLYAFFAQMGKGNYEKAQKHAENLLIGSVDDKHRDILLDTLAKYSNKFASNVIKASLLNESLRNSPISWHRLSKDTLMVLLRTVETLYQKYPSYFGMQDRVMVLGCFEDFFQWYKPPELDSQKIISELTTLKNEMDKKSRIDIPKLREQYVIIAQHLDLVREVFKRLDVIKDQIEEIDFSYQPLNHYLKGEVFMMYGDSLKAKDKFAKVLTQYSNSFFADAVRQRDIYIQEMKKIHRIPHAPRYR